MFRDHIDASRIGAAGFSLGGYTVVALGGGIYDPKQMTAFCQSKQRDFTCEPQQEFPDAEKQFAVLAKTDSRTQESLRRASDSYRDSRVRAVFAMAPVLASGFTATSLRRIGVPVEIVVGDADRVAPAATNASLFGKRIPRAKVSVLPGGIGHYTFLAECTDFGIQEVPICKDEAGVDRANVHEQVARQAGRFFDNALRSTARK
jgi:predicted dienelactone hydrolase